MAQRTISCLHCGLVPTIEDAQGSTRIGYDPGDWQRLCKHPDLGSPALCLLEEAATAHTRPATGAAGQCIERGASHRRRALAPPAPRDA